MNPSNPSASLPNIFRDVLLPGKRSQSFTMTPARAVRRPLPCYSNNGVQPAEDDAWTTIDRGGRGQSEGSLINRPRMFGWAEFIAAGSHPLWVFHFLLDEKEKTESCANHGLPMFPTAGGPCSLGKRCFAPSDACIIPPLGLDPFFEALFVECGRAVILDHQFLH